MSREKFEGLVGWLLVANLFLMRPAALGEMYSAVAMAAALGLVTVEMVFLKSGKLSANKRISSEMQVLLLATAAYLAYVLLLTITFGNSNVEFVIKEVLLTIGIVVSYSIHLTSARANRKFFSRLAVVVSCLGWSALFTFVIAQATGMEFLWLFTVHVAGYESYMAAEAGGVYFPLTMIYNVFNSGNVTLLRAAGFFRESGIFQAVCCTCLVYEGLTRRSRFVLSGLTIGVISTFSSIGVGLWALSCVTVYVLRSKKITLRLIGLAFSPLIIVPAILYAPLIGINAKLETHSTSISDRSTAMLEGILGVASNPWGEGLYSAMISNASITLLAATASIGVFGFLCQFLIVSGWRFRVDRIGAQKVAACLPLLLTAIFSQPIAGAPMIYVLTMLAFSRPPFSPVRLEH